MINQVHPDLSVFNSKGGLFDTGVTDLHQNIQRRVKYRQELQDEAVANNLGLSIVNTEWTIVGVQYDYKKELLYRVVSDEDVHKFGRCAHASELVFID